MIITLTTKDRQPWMKWIERKLRRLGEQWGVEGELGALEANPSRKQKKKEDCLVESTLKIWFEAGGEARERNKEEKKNTQNNKDRQKAKRDRGRTKKEIGIEIDEKWIPITALKTKQIYKQLMQRRLKTGKYKADTAHKNIQGIQTKLTAAERDYWWRLTHNLISTKKKESKWKREESGELVKDKCPVCKEEAEDMPHYNYG